MNLDVEELDKPIPVSPRQGPSPQHFFRYASHTPSLVDDYASREDLLSASVLNQRLKASDPSLSSLSALNSRYVKRPAPDTPGSPKMNGYANGRPSSPVPTPSIHSSRPQSPVGASYSEDTTLPLSAASAMNKRYTINEAPGAANPDLAQTRLNDRYTGGDPVIPPMANGDAPLLRDQPSKHYAKNAGAAPGNREQIPRNYRASEMNGAINRVDNSDKHSEKNMDIWVEELFTQALGDSQGYDDLNDARALQHRVKGGGDTIPGQQVGEDLYFSLS